MKSAVAAILLLWLCLSMELSGFGGIPDHSLILPVACAVMFWFRDGTGILLGGGALLVDWIARPTTLPLVAALIPALAVVLLSRRPASVSYRRRRLPVLPSAWRLPLLTLVAVTLHLISDLPLTADDLSRATITALRTHWTDVALIALPLSLLAALIVRLSDELGVRRVSF